MSNINKASQNEIQQKSAELKKLRNEERKMKSMLAASNGQLAVLQVEALEIKARMQKNKQSDYSSLPNKSPGVTEHQN